MKEIALTRGFVTVVDDEDHEWLSAYKWYATKSGYAARNIRIDGKRHQVRVHRAIMGLVRGDGLEVDHINGNKLDNRRENLRICTSVENCRNKRITSANSSGFKGVHWEPNANRWRAVIWINGKNRYLGLYDRPEDAHKAYCDAAVKLFGEFANSGSAPITPEFMEGLLVVPPGSGRKPRPRGDEVKMAVPIICVGTGARFGSFASAVEWLMSQGYAKACASAVSKACRGIVKKSYGYEWRYADKAA